jgi:hypothetical protein
MVHNQIECNNLQKGVGFTCPKFMYPESAATSEAAVGPRITWTTHVSLSLAETVTIIIISEQQIDTENLSISIFKH